MMKGPVTLLIVDPSRQEPTFEFLDLPGKSHSMCDVSDTHGVYGKVTDHRV